MNRDVMKEIAAALTVLIRPGFPDVIEYTLTPTEIIEVMTTIGLCRATILSPELQYSAGFRDGAAAMQEAAAKECEQLWMAGYRGDVVVGFAHRIRGLALPEPPK